MRNLPSEEGESELRIDLKPTAEPLPLHQWRVIVVERHVGTQIKRQVRDLLVKHGARNRGDILHGNRVVREVQIVVVACFGLEKIVVPLPVKDSS